MNNGRLKSENINVNCSAPRGMMMCHEIPGRIVVDMRTCNVILTDQYCPFHDSRLFICSLTDQNLS